MRIYTFWICIHIFYLHLDAICAAVFYLVQSLLPNGKQRVLADLANKRKAQKNFSTAESRVAFIAVCETETLYKEHYDSKVTRESSVPPYITIIGTLLNPKTIICDFENMTYKFNSLPKAIDICFKAYHLFLMEYAPPARLMWQFINKQFYGLKDACTYPAVHVLIKTIKGNFQQSLIIHYHVHQIILLYNI